MKFKTKITLILTIMFLIGLVACLLGVSAARVAAQAQARQDSISRILDEAR